MRKTNERRKHCLWFQAKHIKRMELGEEKRRKEWLQDDRRQKEDEQTSVRDSDRDHQLSHTYTQPSSPPSPHLSIITPFQHHCISLHHFITHQIIYKPPFIHLSLSIFAVALSLPICSSISLPSRLSSICSAPYGFCVCVCLCVYWDINLLDNVNSKGNTFIISYLRIIKMMHYKVLSSLLFITFVVCPH